MANCTAFRCSTSGETPLIASSFTDFYQIEYQKLARFPNLITAGFRFRSDFQLVTELQVAFVIDEN